MLEENFLDLILAVYSFVTIFTLIIMYKKRAYPKFWIIASISLGVASVTFMFRHINPDFRMIGNIFYFLTAILLGSSILSEYFQKVISNQNIKSKYYIISIIISSVILVATILLFLQNSLINLIQSSLMTFLIIIICVMMKLYNKEKSITHIFMLFTVNYSFCTLLFSVFQNIGIVGSWELAYIMKIMLYSTLLCTGLSAPIEDRMKKTEKKFLASFNRAEFYKDLFIHDINNMLQVILFAIQVLLVDKKGKYEDKELEYFKLIENQVHRGSNLVKNLQKLSKIKEQEIIFEKIEILEIIRRTIERIKNLNISRKIDIQLESDFNKIYIKANELIREVFENLLNNSIKHNTSPEIEIIIKVGRTFKDGQAYNKIEIIDNAKGIEDLRKNSIFSRAFNSETDQKGLGLGLSLVYKIITIFNGKIWVEDRVKGDYKKGSKFIILIPEIS
ncbi:MAG: sensor histidine kinase [Promethearchaeati archaeon]